MPKTKFEKVAQSLVERIQQGIYSNMQRLPSEYQLADEYGVSRLTVRKAIERLVTAKILVKDPGKETYIMSTNSSNKVESGRMGLQSFTEAAETYGKQSRTQVLDYQPLIQPDQRVEEKLNLRNNPQPEVDELVRRRFWNDDPMTIEDIVILHKYVANHQKNDFKHSLFQILAETVEIAYSNQEIEAIKVDEKLAKLLHVQEGDPILCVHSLTYTADGQPIFYDTSYYRADKYTFKTTLTRLEQGGK
ncbi:GntR family transcriptional regulator [Pediococcus acidilactici]|jgi:GntR family transcriptional regulator|uniref:GntR family transcriptional regulator, LSA1692 subfamily n=1 Tax=Pediococcus acidilactici TaxID=1254 RepID=UPI000FE2CB4C|nr:GntR family transcriptional regulator, LSA1692 subfamily [Pediococcus acidilactici]MCH4101796.1 GntR family transcriptional regulator [Pediococcus acidilactici]MCI1351553.1 GntR family transcriptional regulator [Pediococcus acidilactici]MDB8874557.1 GntR family transcriptional regulator [Pediococcus acidilactici]MDB8876485.1 GntR family transcriptional regulator [Pediococcus acidilactici]QHM52022.1 HTH-type transcriptional repressor YvoA [Pediococcus acidilactici]